MLQPATSAIPASPGDDSTDSVAGGHPCHSASDEGSDGGESDGSFRPTPTGPRAAEGPLCATVASPSRRHWVIGDVHGCAEALWDLIRRLPGQDRLVLCGDVINRGPRIEAAMELAWDLVCSGRAVWLMGNHEQRLVQDLRSRDQRSRVSLAGCDTYRQLGARACHLWLERLERLPLAYWADGWVATHAGFDPISWQPDLSVREAFWDAYDGRFGQVIVGHTPAGSVRHRRHIVLIDTGACYGGSLTAYCPETRQERSVPGLSRRLPSLTPLVQRSSALLR